MKKKYFYLLIFCLSSTSFAGDWFKFQSPIGIGKAGFLFGNRTNKLQGLWVSSAIQPHFKNPSLELMFQCKQAASKIGFEYEISRYVEKDYCIDKKLGSLLFLEKQGANFILNTLVLKNFSKKDLPSFTEWLAAQHEKK